MRSAIAGRTLRYAAIALSATLAVATLTVGATATEEPANLDDQSITFVDETPGEAPPDWSTLWRDSDWTVEADPARLVHEGTTSGRQGLSPNAVGVVEGDVEVSAVVRPNSMSGTQQVLFLHASGDAGAENAYYVDFRQESSGRFGYRINRYHDGTFSTLAWSEQPDTLPAVNEWYEMVFQRSGDDLRLKVWPYGTAEPDAWTVVASDSAHTSGRVGFGHTTGGRTVTEWAHIGVSTTGPAPRMPDGVFPPPRVPDAPALVDRTTDHVASTGWDAVEGASYYEVERDGHIVASRWYLTAYADPVPPADTTVTYRVRGVSALLGAGPWSDPLEVRAPGVRFPDSPTPFEETGNLTSIEAEAAFLDDLSEASDRVAIETIGKTVEGRDIRLVRVGHPTAPTDDEIRDRPTLFVNCTVHGNEWTPREACLSFIRDLAMTSDPALLEVLGTHGVVVNPTSNPDGRAANTRANAQGLDVNRDYLALESPEARAVVDVVNRLDPAVVLDGHNCCNDSIVPDWSRHIGVSGAVDARSEDLVKSTMIGAGEQLGYTARPSTLATGNLPVVARNYVGLRNRLGLLNEVRGAAIAGRLEEAPPTVDRTAHIRNRAVNAFEFVLHSTLGYLVEHSADILADNARAETEAADETEPRYYGNQAETALEPEVCGYRLTPEQLDEATSVLEQHRIDVVTVADAPVVSLAQPSGRLVAMLLDGRSAYSLVAGEPVTGTECPTLSPVTPQIHNEAVVGKTVVAWPNQWAPAAQLTFQWNIDGEPIPGATNRPLKITGDLVGRELTVTVTGTRGGQVASATSHPVTVQRAPGTDPVVVSVDVSPEAVSLRAGDMAELSATARDDDGAEQDVTDDAQWASSDESVASVDSAGVVTAVAEGTAEVSAVFADRAGSASVSVSETDVFSTDFKEDDQVIGEAPVGWSALWGDGAGFAIADAPRRMVHTNSSGEQESMVFDAAGVIDYDVNAEVAGLVRLPAASNPTGTSTRFQMHLQASDAAGDHDSFYTDATGSSVRLGRYLDGNWVGRGSAHPYAIAADQWHHVVMQRHDDVWRTKVWPYGHDEPASWMIETNRTTLDGGLPAGQPGIGHFAAGAIQEWAWFSVAVDAEATAAVAERAPADLFEPTPGASVSVVEVTPSTDKVETDDTVELGAVAVYDDGAGQDVTTTAQWISDDESVVTVSADGVVTGVSEGTATVTATFDGVSGSAEITVVDFLMPTTGFEERDGTSWTTLEEEAQFLQAVADRSDRMSYTDVGETAEGRPLHLVRVGYPTAPSDEAIAAGQSIFVVGSQHGNEPAGREAALRHLRDVAFSDDPDVLAQLNDITMLYIPTANPDGRAANRRTNSQSIDTNRDHLNLETAEATAVAEVVVEFDPQMVLDLHERPTGNNPDIELLWPRNLNVDEDLRDLNIDLVENHLMPALNDAEFTTGLYGTPGGSGGGDERISRNVFGLRHKLGLLTETAGQDPPMYRVDAQALAVEQTLAFFHERFDDVIAETTEAPKRRQDHGAAQGTFYLSGRDDVSPPPAWGIIDPGACGYVVTDTDPINRHIELFGITTESLDDGRTFIDMNQPMMTIIPFLVDPRATYSPVDGHPNHDCAELPEPPEPQVHTADFSSHAAWRQPEGWSMPWNPSNFYIQTEPDRLVHYAHFNVGGRKLLTFDEAGDGAGDVEVATLVRVDEPMPTTRFQLHLHASGSAGNETSYYLDIRPDVTRINRYLDGAFNVLASDTTVPTFESDRWYHAVFSRSGVNVRAKVWPYGHTEPTDWLVDVTDWHLGAGSVGIGLPGGNNDTSQFAWLSVGRAGAQAARAPDGIVPLPQVPAPVTDLSASDSVGGVTLAWEPDASAGWYDIERDGKVVTERWRQPSYFDAHTTDGDAATYRVRAVDPVEGPGAWSNDVVVTAADWPDDLITPFEASAGEEFTSHHDELDYIAALDEASPRITVEEIGRSGQDRPIQVVRVGYPEAPLAADLENRPGAVFSCGQHGDEPAGREACLIELRELAFADDDETVEFLSEWAVQFVPSPNPDGREANVRLANGIDTNRDHVALRSPEARAWAELIRDTRPILTADLHEAQYQPHGRREMEVMTSGNLNDHPELSELSWSLITDEYLPAAEKGGFHAGFYMVRGDGNGGRWMTHSSAAKHMVPLLVETLRAPTSYRAEESDEHDGHVRQRRVSSHRFASLAHVRTIAVNRRAEIEAAAAASVTAAEANEGKLYFDGSVFVEPDPEYVIEPPCGYLVTPLAFDTVEPTLTAHGIEWYESSDGYVVPLGQRYRNTAAAMLDELSEAALAVGERLEACPEPGAVDPPSGATFSHDFTEDDPGGTPGGWSELWRPGDWTVLADPSRLRHETGADGNGRHALVLDDAGDVEGDVDITAVVRSVAEDPPALKLQLWLRADAESPAGEETGYYLDIYNNSLRLNRLSSGSYVAGSSANFGGMDKDTWYQIRAQRIGQRNYAKIWPYGDPEPEQWLVASTPGQTLDVGSIGFGHSGTAGNQVEWAYLGIGTGGQRAPQPDRDLGD